MLNHRGREDTVAQLLVEAGETFAAYQANHLRNLPVQVLQPDEFGSFVGCKEKSKASAIHQHPGDVWLWMSICSETKLIPASRVGDRPVRTARDICAEPGSRFAGSIQINDGHPDFDLDRTHFAHLIKISGTDGRGQGHRHSHGMW